MCGAQIPAPRATLHTLGCRLNQAETNLIQEGLEARGYQIVPFGEPADLCVVNTCTVTAEADAKSRQSIRAFIRKNPRAFVAVVGCYSELGYEALAKIEGIDLIVGNQDKMRVLDHIRETKNAQPVIIRSPIQSSSFSVRTTEADRVERRMNLKIQDGCNFMCGYCVVPLARGRERSRDFGDLVAEAEQLAGRGAKEIVLTGVNLGRYHHGDRTIMDVVDRLNGIRGIERIRISSIEPTTIPEALFERMAAPGHALVPHLHIPVQFGSNRMLRLMNRRYSREGFLAFIEQAASQVPDLCIGTDIMTGAPGETDADFAATVSLIEDSPIAYAHVFKYSERDGTAASQVADKVDPKTKNARSAIIRRISQQKRRAFAGRFVGRTVRVLFEEIERGRWLGYTGNYLRVAACSPERLSNEFRNVMAERLAGDILEGTIV